MNSAVKHGKFHHNNNDNDDDMILNSEGCLCEWHDVNHHNGISADMIASLLAEPQQQQVLRGTAQGDADEVDGLLPILDCFNHCHCSRVFGR